MNHIEANMLVHGSIPSSVDAALSYVTEHEKKDFVCDWMPSAESWQKSSECEKDPEDGCGKPISVLEGRGNNVDLCPLSFATSCSPLSTVSTVSDVSAPTLVYHRLKLQRNPVAVSPAEALTKLYHSCFSGISSEALSVGVKEHLMASLVELENEDKAPIVPPVEYSFGSLVSKSDSDNGCSVGEEPILREEFGNDPDRTSHSCENESCSSSKSNLDIGSSSLRTEVDDTGECSSSSALIVEGLQDDLSEKHIFISILASQGLLKKRSVKDCLGDRGGMDSDSGCTRTCKVCEYSEATANMLICDQCEEAYHVRCCNPRLKKIPIDDWFCQTCLKDKYRILKETAKGKSVNIWNEISGCRDARTKDELGPIASMLSNAKPYTSSVRIGEDFQAEVPDWSGPAINAEGAFGEASEINSSAFLSLQVLNSIQSRRMSSIGNWLQCREVIEGTGGVDGTICGKWRRAPLFELQTDGWECFCAVLWDPVHADCAVPQELDTDQVLKQLKYIEMLRPRLVAKRRKLSHAKNVHSEDCVEKC